MTKLEYAPACALSNFLGIQHPIIQAPMGGGIVPSTMAAAVSNGGGLGSIAAAYLSPAQIRDEIQIIRQYTDKPFNVNLFAGGRATSNLKDSTPMMNLLRPYSDDLNVEIPVLPAYLKDPFPEQIEVIISERVPIFSFTFGIPDASLIQRLKDNDIKIMGSATTVAEAIALEKAGVDIIVAQSSEAGAHRGTFLANFEDAMIGSFALLPQVVNAVSVPVIAAGGIMDGRGIIAAFALGASGVQMGTAFMTCPESTIPEGYKQAIENANAEETVLTRAYSGRPARGIKNRFMDDIAGREDDILSFPFQNELTRPMRNAASAKGDTRCMSLFAGQAAHLARRIKAQDMVETLIQEAIQVCQNLAC